MNATARSVAVVVWTSVAAGACFAQTLTAPSEGRVKLVLRNSRFADSGPQEKVGQNNPANDNKNPPAEKNNKDKEEEEKEEQEEKRPLWKRWQPSGRVMTLGECLAVGRERQPTILAATASLAAAERGYLALIGLRRAAEILSPDLPIRRLQSQRGLVAAAAEVVKVRQDNTYDISRMYFTYVYATQQEQTAAEIVEQLESFFDIAKEFLKLPVPDPKVKINEFSLGDIDAVIAEVRELREEASTGRKKALHALKEAMGVPHDFEIIPADKELPIMGGSIDQATVVNFALSRRAELVQAEVLVDVTRLEVCAQSKLTRRIRANTFASGSDLHARYIPAAVRNGEYRPGAIAPEMPTEIVGSVEDRVGRMSEHLRVHEAAQAKVRGLLELEAVNAYLNWEQAVRRVKDSREAHQRAQSLVEKARLAAQAKPEPELLVRTESLASKAQARYVKAVHDQINALIALEKVTAGGVVPLFQNR